MIALVVKYFHFIGILGVVITLSLEWTLLKKSLTKGEIKRLAKIDGMYGLSAILVIAAGVTMWLWVGKPPQFYADNPLFWIKFGLFGVIGAMSLPPTIFFLKHRAKKPEESEESVTVPNYLKYLIRIEVILLFALPLLAVLMANGIGLK